MTENRHPILTWWTALFALAGPLAASDPAFAQAFGVTEIAGPTLNPNEPPSINEAGTVVFPGTLGGSFEFFIVGAGNGDAPEIVYDAVPAPVFLPPPLPGQPGPPFGRVAYPIVNDNGQIAFFAQAVHGWLMSGTRFGSPLTAPIRSCTMVPGDPYWVIQDPGGNDETVLTFNSEGRAIVAGVLCPGMIDRALIEHFQGTATTLVDTTSGVFERFAEVALAPDDDRFAFTASVSGGTRLFFVDNAPAVEIAGSVIGPIQSPDLNRDGTIAFIGAVTTAVYTLDTTDPMAQPLLIVDTTSSGSPWASFLAVAINASGQLAIHGRLKLDSREALTVYDPLTSTFRTAAEADVMLYDGAQLDRIGFGRDGFNDAGQLAIRARLGDGRKFVLRLEPGAPQQVDLVLVQNVLINPVSPGSPVEIGFTVANQGAVDADLARLVYQVPPGFGFDAAQGCEAVLTLGQLDCFLSDLPAGRARTIMLTLTPYLEGLYPSYAEAKASDDQPDANPDDNEHSALIDVVAGAGQANLQLENTVTPEAADPGAAIFYSLQVTNTGPETASTVRVVDHLPGDLDPDTVFFAGNVGGGTFDILQRRLDWTIGDLPVGFTAQLDITAQLFSNIPCQRLVSTASVSLDQADLMFPNVVEAVLQVPTTGCADLAVNFEVDEPSPDYDTDVEFHARVENTGQPDADATGVAVEVLVAPDLIVDPASLSPGPPAATFDAGSNRITWTLGDVPSGAPPAELRFVARTPGEAAVPQAALIATASLQPFDQQDLSPGNDVAQAKVILGATDLRVTTSSEALDGGEIKSTAGGDLLPVDIEYQLRNLGPSDADGFVFEISFEVGRDFLGASSNVDSNLDCNGVQPVTCSSDVVIAAGQVASLTVQFGPLAPEPRRTVIHGYTVRSRSPLDPEPANDAATARVVVTYTGECGLIGVEIAPLLAWLWRRRRCASRQREETSG